MSEERFDKIRYYLKHGNYPTGSDRAEKSRLRSAATHYKLIPEASGEPEKLMLKGKEVVSEPLKQYEVARKIHCENHAGINKTTAVIAEKYHWVRIKETVNAVIRNCDECKAQVARAAAMRGENQVGSSNYSRPQREADDIAGHRDVVDHPPPTAKAGGEQQYQAPMAQMSRQQDYEMPVDPRIMEGVNQYSFRQPSQARAHYPPQGNDNQTSQSSPFEASSISRSDLLYASNIEQRASREASSGSPHPLSTDARIQQQLLDAGYGS